MIGHQTEFHLVPNQSIAKLILCISEWFGTANRIPFDGPNQSENQSVHYKAPYQLEKLQQSGNFYFSGNDVDAHLKSPKHHHSTMVSRGLREALNWAPITPRDTSFSRTADETFPILEPQALSISEEIMAITMKKETFWRRLQWKNSLFFRHLQWNFFFFRHLQWKNRLYFFRPLQWQNRLFFRH